MTNNLINIFDNILYDFDTYSSNKTKSSSPLINILENEKSYKIELPLNGLDPNQVNINLKNNILYIKYERIVEEKTPKDKEVDKDELKLVHYEFSKYEKFERSIKLSQEIDKKSVKAKNNNGLLEITINKIVDNGTVIEIE